MLNRLKFIADSLDTMGFFKFSSDVDKVIKKIAMSLTDAYSLFGLNRSADEDEVKKRYRELAKESHPDLAPEDQKAEAETKMKLINEAYDLINRNLKSGGEWSAPRHTDTSYTGPSYTTQGRGGAVWERLDPEQARFRDVFHGNIKVEKEDLLPSEYEKLKNEINLKHRDKSGSQYEDDSILVDFGMGMVFRIRKGFVSFPSEVKQHTFEDAFDNMYGLSMEATINSFIKWKAARLIRAGYNIKSISGSPALVNKFMKLMDGYFKPSFGEEYDEDMIQFIKDINKKYIDKLGDKYIKITERGYGAPKAEEIYGVDIKNIQDVQKLYSLLDSSHRHWAYEVKTRGPMLGPRYVPLRDLFREWKQEIDKIIKGKLRPVKETSSEFKPETTFEEDVENAVNEKTESKSGVIVFTKVTGQYGDYIQVSGDTYAARDIIGRYTKSWNKFKKVWNLSDKKKDDLKRELERSGYKVEER